MPTELVLPAIGPDSAPDADTGTPFDTGGPWIVILYNCNCHSFDQVIHQLQLATGCGQARAEQVAEEAHHRGRVVALTGDPSECERAAGILRSIGLQVETDRL